MIVDEYCHNCPEFEVTVETISSGDFYGDMDADHAVKCKYAERCERIKEYLDGRE